MSGTTAALAAAGTAAVLYGIGSVAEAVGARRSSAPLSLIRSLPYLAGLACDGVAWLLSLAALTRLPLFVVQPILTASLAVTAVAAAFALRAPLRRSVVLWICVLIMTLVALVISAGTESVVAAGVMIRVLLAISAAVVVAAIVLFRNRGPALLAVMAGLAFSGASIAARAIGVGLGTLVTNPLAYVIVVFGVAGAWAYAAALERGPVTPVTAMLWSIEVVVPTAVGIAALGDTVRPGFWPVFTIALVGVLVATVMLAGGVGPDSRGYVDSAGEPAESPVPAPLDGPGAGSGADDASTAPVSSPYPRMIRVRNCAVHDERESESQQ